MGRKPAVRAESIDLKRLRLRDGDILVIREPENAPLDYRKDILERLGKVVRAASVILIFSPSLSDIKAISPEQLAKIGLQRIPDDS